MTSSTASNLPVKWLLALTALVLLVHLMLLQGKPLALGLSQPQSLRTFITRAIEPPPLTTPPAVTPRKAKPVPPTAKTPAAPSTTSPTLETPPVVTEKSVESSPKPAESAPETPTTEVEPPAASLRPRDQTLAVSAYAVPGSARLKYKVETNKFPYSASADLLWQQDGEGYEARLELSVFGQTRVQTSRGQVTPAGLAPIRFSDKFRSEVAAHFNREKGKVTFSANTPDAPLLAGAQDRLSILVQLAAMLAGNPAQYPPVTTLTIQTIGPRDADTWLFTVGNEEQLSLPGGELNTVKLVRNPRQEFDQKVELWLAPALGYLPARIRITEPNGDFIDQKWSSTEPRT